MRLFVKLVVEPDASTEDDNLTTIERLVSSDVDIALWLREQVQEIDQEHGAAWEATLDIHPLTEGE